MAPTPKRTQTEHIVLPLADDETLEELYLAQTKTRTHFLQVSKGPADLVARSLDLGQVQLFEAQGDGHHLWHDEMLAQEWRIAVMADAGATTKVGPVELTPSHVSVMRPGETTSLLTNGPYQTLEINVPDATAYDLGWPQRGELFEASAGQVEALISSAHAALSTFAQRSGRRNNFATVPWATILLDQITDLFETSCIDGPSKTATNGAYAQSDIVRRAFAKLRDVDYAKSATIDGLCADLAVSRRSLFLAFQKQLGLGPRRLNELVRLHFLRARLFRAAPETTSVANEAEQAGFADFGRLSGIYRDVFGELPRDTLRTVHQEFGALAR
ncbi:MAG: helix-turn-helix domain-containing protein [Pseudomonadota bacterium]